MNGDWCRVLLAATCSWTALLVASVSNSLLSPGASDALGTYLRPGSVFAGVFAVSCRKTIGKAKSSGRDACYL
jgi:hypothetical protein